MAGTKNYYIGPSDGWEEVIAGSSTAITFLRISGYPHTHPYYLYSGSSAPSLVATAGTGTVTFTTGVPTNGQVVTIGSETYTFVTAGSAPFQVVIGASNTATATAFTAVVNANSTLVKASDASGVVTLTSLAVGTQGNYALTKTASNVTLSGAAMTGGTNTVQGILVCHKPFWMNVSDSNNYYIRVPNPVPNSRNADSRLRLDVLSVGGVLS